MTYPPYLLRSRPPILALALFFALSPAAVSATWSLPARADPRPAPPTTPGANRAVSHPPAPPGSVLPCGHGTGSALAELACELANALEASAQPILGSGLLVSSGPLAAEVEIRAAAELVARLTSTVAGRIGHGARVDSLPRTLVAAQGVAKGLGTQLLYLRPELRQGELRVVADVYTQTGRFWQRLRTPSPPARLHTYASRRLDPELRTFLPSVPLVGQHIDKVPAPERQGVALACQDVDADGSLELLLVGRQRIVMGRIRAGKLETHRSVIWRDLSAVAPAPLTEPIAGVWVEPGLHIDVGSSDRAQAVRFNPLLEPIAQTERQMPWPTGGCSRYIGFGVASAIAPCLRGDPDPERFQPKLEASSPPGDALAAVRFLDGKGQSQHVRALRDASSGEVVLRDARGREARGANLGAQLALGDIDGNGEVELVAGADVLDSEKDELLVATWRVSGALEPRHRLPVPKGIRALAICPSDGWGPASIAMIAGDELWVVR